MAFRDPVAVYNSANNIEAHLVCKALTEAGIDALVIEDVSQVGVWLGGLIPEIHKPQVWVERDDMERAKPVLDDYERIAAQRRAAEAGDSTSTPITVTCEDCGKTSEFPASQKGSTQECPHCGAFVDVGDDEDFADWDEDSAEE